MVILQIDVNRVSTIPAERDAPIPGNAERPTLCATQGVKMEAGQIKLIRLRRGIERAQHAPNPSVILNAQSLRVARLEVKSQRPIAERADHLKNMRAPETAVKLRLTLG